MKILWILFVWPEPDSSAAGFRTLRLLQALRDAGHDVAVCSPCAPNTYMARLIELGFNATVQPSNDDRFDTYVKELDPDTVVFDRFMIEEQFSWRVRKSVPAAARVLDTVDLQSVRKIRETKVQQNIDAQALTQSDLGSEIAIREISSIHRSDYTFVVSDFERDLLRNLGGISETRLSICSFMYEPLKGVLKPFEDRANFVAIGNFNHRPNCDSFRCLHSEIWPRIRSKISNCELHVYGAYPKREFTDLDNPASGFRVLGKVEDAPKTLAGYRVNLAPLRFGAGIKGKVADGWFVGTPCVGTSIAAEGMCGGLSFGGAVHDDWDAFASAAVALYSSSDNWRIAQNRGIEILRKLFDENNNRACFLEIFENIQLRLQELRESNLVGAMLWHHTARSTEYFSRYITVKNALLQDAGK